MTTNNERPELKRSLILIGVILCSSSPGIFPREHRTEGRCATYSSRLFDELAKHAYRVRERKRALKDGRIKPSERPPLRMDVGSVAVIEDDGSIISSGMNPFDLRGRSLRFVPRPEGGYDLSLATTGIDTSFSRQIPLSDDDSRSINLSSNFPFYGMGYGAVFLNTDGNLTFGAGDNASTDRSLRRFRTGPPRIAGFFDDLNPEDGGRIFADARDDRTLFTWDRVAEFGVGNANTFQITLFNNGEILLVYSSAMEALEAIVGLSPGGAATEQTLVNYDVDLPQTVSVGALAEIFSNSSTGEIDLIALAQAFYSSHSDDFDNLVIFSAPSVNLGGAVAFFMGVKNDVRGLGDVFSNGAGDDLFEFSSAFGSRGRLEGILNMNQISQYPSDPTTTFLLGGNNTLDVMGQESGHRFGAFLLLNENGIPTNALLGRDDAHWSFFTDSNASELEGNDIRDNGDGTFTTVDITQRYSQLDQYLMGLRPPADVEPFFFVKDPTGTPFTRGSSPQRFITFSGSRRDVTIEEIIATNGARSPDSSHARKTFKQAFILLIGHGESVQSVDMAKIERIRSAWEAFFPGATDNLGSVDTTLSAVATPTSFTIPFLEGDAQRYTGIAAANRDTLPASVTFTAYAADGQLLNLPDISNPATVILAGGEQRALLDSQLFGFATAASRSGWIQVESPSDRVTVFFLSGDLEQNFLDGAVAAKKLSTELVMTRLFEGAGALFAQEARTRISLVHPGAGTAQATLRYYDAAGALVETVNREITGNGRLVESFRDLFPTVNLPVTSGHLEISSDLELAGVEVVRFGQTLFALPAQEPVAAQRLYSAQFASGGVGVFPAPFFTNLKLVNSGDGEATVTIRIVAEDGSLLQVAGATNPLVRNIPSRGELSGDAMSLFGFPNDRTDPVARVGSVIVEVQSGRVVGDVVFGDALEGNIMAGLALERRLFTGMIFSQVAEGASGSVNFFSGLAVLNPNDMPVELAISVFDEKGRLTGFNSIELPAGHRISRTLSQLIPNFPGQLRGYILLDVLGGKGAAIFELFGDSGLQRFLAAVPPQAYAIAP